MAQFIHSILRANAAVAADGDEVVDLPVNPLSVILIHISPLNETDTITTYSLISALLSALDTVRVTHKGASIVDVRGDDLAMVSMMWHRMPIWQSGAWETTDFRRSIVLPIVFGRKAYMANECFPATKKGELQLTMTWDIADTGFDGLRRSIETIELPDAAPTHVQKVTTLAQSFGAAGQNDVDVPIGNVIRALLCWGASGWTGATPAPTWGALSVYVNNLQRGYSATDWEVSRALRGLCGIPYPPSFEHIHSVDASGVAREDTLEPQMELSKDHYYTLLDFDPLQNDEYSLDTEGASRVHVRATAEAAETVRVLPIEKVPVSRYLE